MDTKKLKQNAPVFILWTLIYWGYLYWFFRKNWEFHIFSSKDWQFFVEQWDNGWVVHGTDQWVFILVLLVAIPVWYFVLKLLLPLPYKKWYEDIFFDSIYKRKMEHLHDTEQAQVTKRPSYRKVRPKELPHGITKPVTQPTEAEAAPAPTPTQISDIPAFHPQSAAAQSSPSAAKPKLTVPMTITSADPFHLQDSIYEDETELPQEPAEPIVAVPFEDMEESVKPVKEDLQQIMEKQCAVFPNATVDGAPVSFIAVGGSTVYLCQVDDAEGDWLADEEPFGSEAPLWFSDRSHRVSPVFELTKKQEKVQQMLLRNDIQANCRPVLIKTQGVILNAEEMTSAWQNADVIVCRSQSGGPASLPLFKTAFPKEEPPSQAFVKKVKDALSLTSKSADKKTSKSAKSEKSAKTKTRSKKTKKT